MMALVGGLIALLLGLIALFGWWGAFIGLIKGVLPPILILGGALAAYLGAEELKDQKAAVAESAQEPFTAPDNQELDRYKSEVAELKAKLADLEKNESAS